ncbi:MAG: serine/threonine-protein kinase, partial [Myxococcota bacterium]
MSLSAGTLLTPTLRLEYEIGKGAMGEVWAAENLALGSRVAVKLMHGAESEESLRRFEAEAKGVARINSPHVVQVFDFGRFEQEPYIVMELLEGVDLRAHIEEAGPMELHEIDLVIRQTCNALSVAHEAGIIHRDIKPANLFLARSGSDLFVKVLDFGIAKFSGINLGMTSTGVMMGTPYYASPEQLVNPKSIDHRSDLWSVAVVTYACLTGKLPFIADTLGGLSIAIHKGDFTPPSSHRKLAPAIDAWMRRGLAREATDRFSTAHELASSLHQALRAPYPSIVDDPTEEASSIVPAPVMATVMMDSHATGPGTVMLDSRGASPSTVMLDSSDPSSSGTAMLDPSAASSVPGGGWAPPPPPLQPLPYRGEPSAIGAGTAGGQAVPSREAKSRTPLIAVALVTLFVGAGGSVYAWRASNPAAAPASPSAPAAPPEPTPPGEDAVAPAPLPRTDATAASPPQAAPAPPDPPV